MQTGNARKQRHEQLATEQTTDRPQHSDVRSGDCGSFQEAPAVTHQSHPASEEERKKSEGVTGFEFGVAAIRNRRP